MAGPTLQRRLAAAALIVVALVASSPAHATSPSPDAHKDQRGKPAQVVGLDSLSPADQARQRAQTSLLELNDRVYEVASASYEQQFAGAEVDLEHSTLNVFWVGKIPPRLIDLRVNAAGSSASLNITAAKFSRRQMMDAARQIMPNGEMDGSVELAVDGSGITVAVGDLPAVVSGARAPTAAESRLIQRINAVRNSTRVPVTVKAADPRNAQFDSREADTSPFWAGARMNFPSRGTSCTSGFSMYASGATSIRHTLTAAHCSGFNDNVHATTGAGLLMGHTESIQRLYHQLEYDLGTVRLNSGNWNGPHIYVDDVCCGTISVGGYAAGGIPAGGNYCVNALTARNCNLLSGPQRRLCLVGFTRCIWTIQMDSINGNMTWCRGDSGGPIYYWNGNSVVAAGVVSWSNHELGDCSLTGGASVVATAVGIVPGLRVVTTSAP